LHIDDLLKLQSAIFGLCKDTIVERGEQYSTTADTLAAFKRASVIAQTSPSQVCLNLLAVKVSRLSQLITDIDKSKNTKSKYRILEDTIVDLINYLVLLYAIESEK
jgi:hypothetical protein